MECIGGRAWLGALILSIADWRWLFVVNLPLGTEADQPITAFGSR
jgi:hypothetical protein